jgi:hypothetical protein
MRDNDISLLHRRWRLAHGYSMRFHRVTSREVRSSLSSSGENIANGTDAGDARRPPEPGIFAIKRIISMTDLVVC